MKESVETNSNRAGEPAPKRGQQIWEEGKGADLSCRARLALAWEAALALDRGCCRQVGVWGHLGLIWRFGVSVRL